MSNSIFTNLISVSYSGIGIQQEIIIPKDNTSNTSIGTIAQGIDDNTSLQVKLHPNSQWITLPEYKNIIGDFPPFRIPNSCYAIRLNIENNISDNIILELRPE